MRGNPVILTDPEGLMVKVPGTLIRECLESEPCRNALIAGAAATAESLRVMITSLMEKDKKKDKKPCSERDGSTPVTPSGDPDKDPSLKRIHSEETIRNSNKSSYDYWSKRSTQEIVDSLRPGSDNELLVKPDGRIMNGNTRILILEERGFDINSLPRTYY